MKQLIYSCIDELNATLEKKIVKSEDTVLVGEIDSITLVSLIVAIEDKTGKTIADDRAMSRRTSPFLSVGALIEYVDELCKK
jgi:acyl carrier protein